MKRQIRFGTFETNSSSTHTLTLCTKQEFEDWKNGKLMLDWDKLVPSDEKDEDLETYGEWYDDEYLETYVKEYTTESGDQIVVFGKYGYT